MLTMKRTPIYESHKELGANIVPFAGYEMPLVYSTMIDEHMAVRNVAGLFDVSHMGEISIHGRDAILFTNYLITNQTTDMQNGDIKYSPLCYEDGGEVDDLLAYRLAETHMLLVVNASNTEKDFLHILSIHEKHPEFQVEITNLSDQYGQVAFQGPEAETILQTLTSFDLTQFKVFTCHEIEIAGRKTITSRTGYTGEDGFEILASNNDILIIWKAILEAGKAKGVLPCGLGSRDTLRFEVCLWLYGNDIDNTTNPLEAGQTFAVKLEKSFVGSDILCAVSEQGPKRKLTCFELDGKMIPRHGMEIFHQGKPIGYVTSGSYCPKINRIAAMGYIPSDLFAIGSSLDIQIRGKMVPALMVKKPFYKGTSGRKDRR